MTKLDRILDKVIRKCPAGAHSILSLREAAEIACGIVEDETATLRAEVEALTALLRETRQWFTDFQDDLIYEAAWSARDLGAELDAALGQKENKNA